LPPSLALKSRGTKTVCYNSNLTLIIWVFQTIVQQARKFSEHIMFNILSEDKCVNPGDSGLG
jgi:hypothetical protein